MAARGFTLIELLISITIIGVVLVVVMGAFRIGINAWEKGEADIETYQRQQIVLQLIKQQLASIQPAAITKEGADPYFFLGNERTVEFVSDASIVPGNRYGRVFVKYRLRQSGEGEAVSLEIHEKSLASGAGESLFEPLDEAYHMLLDNMAAIRFEFLLKEPDAPPQWLRDWDPQAFEGELPEAVRLTLRAKAGGAPVSVVGRVASELTDN